MHLGLVLARLAEHIHDVPAGRRVVAVPAVHDGGDLHAAFRAQGRGFLRVDFDVVRHGLALHQHPGLGPDGVEYAHEGELRALDDLDDLAFPPVVSARLARHGHDDRVAVEGLARLGRLDEDVLRQAFDDDEDEAFARHLDAAGIFGIDSGRLVTGAVVAAFPYAFPAHLQKSGGMVGSLGQR